MLECFVSDTRFQFPWEIVNPCRLGLGLTGWQCPWKSLTHSSRRLRYRHSGLLIKLFLPPRNSTQPFTAEPSGSRSIVKLDPDPQGSRGAAGMIYSELEGKYQNFVSTFWFEICFTIRHFTTNFGRVKKICRDFCSYKSFLTMNVIKIWAAQ